MGRTHKKVSISPAGIPYTPEAAAADVEQALRMLEGRWKLLILFQLFGGGIRRFSELERAIPAVTQKMLAQQLRQLEKDGLIVRKVYPEIPPKVEYALTDWGQSLCPVLDAFLKWSAANPGSPAPPPVA
jgi:DNA-binding HxlR family transcriptional regulator